MRKKSFTLAFGLYFILSSHVFAEPRNVIIIRHAEKIPKENHLDLKGFERAAALPYYFSNNPIYNDPPITHVFAAGLENADSSIRPIQTCTPTANHYKLPLNIDFMHTQTKELANELLTQPKYNNATVLVCWSHGHIPPIALALGTDDPGLWDKTIFDQVYFIRFEKDKKPKLEKILQKLMFGDRIHFNDAPLPIPAASKRGVDVDV
jgi:hypothetical protein